MYRYEDIRQVHLELTSRCNARCPQCSRNLAGGAVNPHLPLGELSLLDIQTIFPPEFIAQLDSMFLCGNYGDPMVAQDTIAVVDYFRGCNPKLHIGVATNGSGRSPEWWVQLANVVSYCNFGIDGLEDTNHLYRQGTSWQKVMESVKAYISAGGIANWDFIVFRHNEHQVGAAKELSHKMGFRRFRVKATSRFFSPSLGGNKSFSSVRDRDGKEVRRLEPPLESKYQNQPLIQLGGTLLGQHSYDTYVAETEICCKAVKKLSIYVSFQGVAFPCCWISNIYQSHMPVEKHEVWRLINQLPEGLHSLNALSRGIRAVVEGPFFQSMVPETWRPGIGQGQRLEVCARTCGVFDGQEGQFCQSYVNESASAT